MSRWLKRLIAPSGTVGNVTTAGVEIDPAVDISQLLLKFIVEAIGTTVTYKWQVTADSPDVSDANATWVDLNYIVYGDTTEAVVTTTRARTTVGTDVLVPFVGAKARQIFRRIRLVTSANTGVTFRAELDGIDTTP